MYERRIGMKKFFKVILSTFIIFASLTVYGVHGEDKNLDGGGVIDVVLCQDFGLHKCKKFN